MKNTILLLLSLFVILGIAISCDDIEDNSPAFQAKVDTLLYRSNDARAEIKEDGSLVLQGITDFEMISMHLSNSVEGTYPILGDGFNRASFQTSIGSVYTTKPFGHGEVKITQSDASGISGNFNFTGYRFGLDTLVVSQGFFYKVPIISGSTEDEPEPQNFLFTAQVNGQNFVPSMITALDNGDQIVVSGTVDNNTITLSFPNLITVGNYTIDNATYRATYSEGDTTFETQTGSLTVSAHYTDTKQISGTFSFICGDENTPYEITAGEFIVTYQ